MSGTASGKIHPNEKRLAWTQAEATKRHRLNSTWLIGLLVITFKLLGLSPISVDNFRLTRTKSHLSSPSLTFKKSGFGLVYSYILIVVIFAVSFITIPLLDGGSEKTDLLVVFETAKGVVGLIGTLVIWLIVALQYGTIPKILNRIVDIDNKMMTLQGLYHPERHDIPMLVIFLGNFAWWIAIFVLQICSVDDWLATLVPKILPLFVMNWYIMQYVLMLMLMAKRFSSVNREFMIVASSRIKTLVQVDVRVASMSEREMVNQFNELRQVYAALSAICRDIDKYYSFPILLVIGFFAGASLYHAYYVIQPFLVDDDDVEPLKFASLVLRLFIKLLPMLALSVSVGAVLNQVQMTNGTIYKILCHSALRHLADEELKEFSYQLLNENVQFTAYDIFSLDCSMIQSILSMMATYLIILMQFQVEHTEDEEPSRYDHFS